MRLRVLVGLMLTTALLLGPDRAALGASFTVDSTVDAVDANPGDGVCAAATGACTLRAAIEETNALPGADTIVLPAGTYLLSIPGADEDASATGDLDVADDLTLTGIGADATVIDGGRLDRVFHTSGPITVDISGVAIQNGLAAGGFDPGSFELGMGGGIFNGTGASLTLVNAAVRANFGGVGGGGIFNAGTLTLVNTTVSDNTGGVAVEGGGGGGIGNQGTATLDNSRITANTSQHSGGGLNNSGTLALSGSLVSGNTVIVFSGGGIFNSGTLTMSNTDLVDNRAEEGGGGLLNLSQAAIVESSISGNSTTEFEGGGIANDAGIVMLNSVTVSGNSAPSGAGVANGTGQASPVTPSTLEVLNTTISGNSSAGSSGGGIANGGGINAATATLTNVTVTANSAGLEGGGIFNNPAGTVALKNTIVAGSTGGNCSGPITSGGHNLDTDGTCGGPADFSPGELLLGPLADNGGPTLTHALLPGHLGGCQGDACIPPAANFAIDGGDNSGCPDTDQRRVVRPLDGNGDGRAACDIGAYEAGPATVTATPAATPTPALSQTPGPVQLPQTGYGMATAKGDMANAKALGLVGVIGLALAGMTGLVASSKTGKGT